jgi:hypothetical protein
MGRCVHVDSRGILEALRDVYHADRVLNELLTGSMNEAPAAKAATTKK